MFPFNELYDVTKLLCTLFASQVRQFKGMTLIDIREHYVDKQTMDTR